MSEKLKRAPRGALVKTYLLVELGSWVPYDDLRRVSGMDDVPRYVRTMRADGWPIEIDGASRVRLRAEPMGEPRGDGKTLTATMRVAVLERDGGRCRLCGFAAGETNELGEVVRLQVDHIVPRHHGGCTEMSNLRALCRRCNHDKQATSDRD